MKEKKFTIGDAFKYGFNTFIDNFSTLGLGLLAAAGTYAIVFFTWTTFTAMLLLVNVPGLKNIFMSPTSLFTIFSYAVTGSSFIIILIGYLLVLFVYYGLLGGFIKLCLNIFDYGKGKVSDIYSSFHIAPQLWAAGILYHLIVIGGLILLVIPGIYFAIRFSLYIYFIVDKQTGIVDALRKSYYATSGHFFEIFIISLIITLLTPIPMIGFIIMTFGWPIIYTYIYRKLTPQTQVI